MFNNYSIEIINQIKINALTKVVCCLTDIIFNLISLLFRPVKHGVLLIRDIYMSQGEVALFVFLRKF